MLRIQDNWLDFFFLIPQLFLTENSILIHMCLFNLLNNKESYASVKKKTYYNRDNKVK